MSGNGHRSLRDSLLGSGARPGTWLASGRGGFAREDYRSDWARAFNLESNMAQIDDRVVRHERFYLVDSLFDLFV